MQPIEHNKIAEWISNLRKQLGFKEGPKAKILIDSLKTTIKIYQIGKQQALMAHTDSCRTITPIHDQLAIEMNRCQQQVDVPEWTTKRKTTLIQKVPLKGTTPNNNRRITCLSLM